MAIEFKGTARTLKGKDFEVAAERRYCEVAAIRTVADVEPGGRGAVSTVTARAAPFCRALPHGAIV